MSLERTEAIKELHRNGWTLERIGNAIGVSRERIRQILKNAGVTRADGGQTVLTIERRKQLLKGMGQRRERASLRAYGCSHERAVELNQGKNLSDSHGRAHVFRSQKKNAQSNRGIKWEMTFPEWCEIWEESGMEHMRGRGKGKYCMARIADTGPYTVGNVEIITNDQNASDSYLVTSAAERSSLRGHSRNDLGLTPTQNKALLLYKAGLNNGAVAEAMGIKRNTATIYKATLRSRGVL